MPEISELLTSKPTGTIKPLIEEVSSTSSSTSSRCHPKYSLSTKEGKVVVAIQVPLVVRGNTTLTQMAPFPKSSQPLLCWGHNMKGLNNHIGTICAIIILYFANKLQDSISEVDVDISQTKVIATVPDNHHFDFFTSPDAFRKSALLTTTTLR